MKNIKSIEKYCNYFHVLNHSDSFPHHYCLINDVLSVVRPGLRHVVQWIEALVE